MPVYLNIVISYFMCNKLLHMKLLITTVLIDLKLFSHYMTKVATYREKLHHVYVNEKAYNTLTYLQEKYGTRRPKIIEFAVEFYLNFLDKAENIEK